MLEREVRVLPRHPFAHHRAHEVGCRVHLLALPDPPGLIGIVNGETGFRAVPAQLDAVQRIADADTDRFTVTFLAGPAGEESIPLTAGGQ